MQTLTGAASVPVWKRWTEMKSKRIERGARFSVPLQESRRWREVLRLRRGGGGHGGVADGVTVDDQLDAAVALAAFGGVIGGDGLVLAEAAGGDGRTGDALLGKKIADGIGAAFGELLIEIVAADAVGVTLDLEREAGMRKDDAGNFGELLARAGLERVTTGVKEHVRHIDDEAAGGVAGLQDGVQLAEELGAKLAFFGFGLRGGAARFLGFGLGGTLQGLRGSPVSCGLVGGGLRGLLLD